MDLSYPDSWFGRILFAVLRLFESQDLFAFAHRGPKQLFTSIGLTHEKSSTLLHGLIKTDRFHKINI